MHNAKAGGEYGANGEFYKGGQFVADTEDWVKRHRESLKWDERVANQLLWAKRESIIAAGYTARRMNEILWAQESDWVGEEGEKMERKLTLTDSFRFERQAYRGWGTEEVQVMKFRDDDGNVLVWFTIGRLPDISVNQQARLAFTVSRHTTHNNNERQTMISRVRIAPAKKARARNAK